MNMHLLLSSFLLTTLLFFGCDQGSQPAPEETGSVPVSKIDEPWPVSYLTGKFDPTTHPDFTIIRPEHANQSGLVMRKDAYQAFLSMYEAAQQDGVRLQIISATRNFDRQKQIWEKKWTGATLVEGGVNLATDVPDPTERAKRILRFSSMPGISRHHWGTDIDLNDLNNEWFSSGEGLKIYTWLQQHAHTYGFCQPYSPKGPERPDGYEEEKWHWSYMPVARELTRQAAVLLKDEDIAGFLGDQTAQSIGVVQKYILGINPLCK